MVFEDVMWGLNNILYRPSTTAGVETSHLKVTWVRGSKTITFRPHIQKRRIPERPIFVQPQARFIMINIGRIVIAMIV